jgi:UDP-N-acetylglucosamine transferase subunit ALG13
VRHNHVKISIGQVHLALQYPETDSINTGATKTAAFVFASRVQWRASTMMQHWSIIFSASGAGKRFQSNYRETNFFQLVSKIRIE